MTDVPPLAEPKCNGATLGPPPAETGVSGTPVNGVAVTDTPEPLVSESLEQEAEAPVEVLLCYACVSQPGPITEHDAD